MSARTNRQHFGIAFVHQEWLVADTAPHDGVRIAEPQNHSSKGPIDR